MFRVDDGDWKVLEIHNPTRGKPQAGTDLVNPVQPEKGGVEHWGLILLRNQQRSQCVKRWARPTVTVIMATALLSLVVALSGCRQTSAVPQQPASTLSSPESSSTAPPVESVPKAATDTSPWAEEEVAFADASGTERVIRIGRAATATPAGDRFSPTADGQFFAILQKGSLSVVRRQGGTEVQKIPRVSWFAWRPGTQDLVYIARSGEGNRPEWRILTPDGQDTMFGSGTLSATLSPTGAWFVTVSRPSDTWELVAVSLSDLRTVTFPGSQEGFPELKWAGPSSVSFIEGGERITLLALNTGQRTTFLEGKGELSGPMQWAPDGSRVAASMESGKMVIWGREGALGEVPGDWSLIAWSPTGRYLAMEERKTESVFVVDTWETAALRPVRIPGKWSRRLEWHPSSEILALSVRSAAEGVEQVQVWDFTDGTPKSTVIGPGTRDPLGNC